MRFPIFQTLCLPGFILESLSSRYVVYSDTLTKLEMDWLIDRVIDWRQRSSPPAIGGWGAADKVAEADPNLSFAFPSKTL